MPAHLAALLLMEQRLVEVVVLYVFFIPSCLLFHPYFKVLLKNLS